MRALAVVLALALAALGWQSWRLNNASHTIETQGAALKSKTQELTKKNSQLIGLSILTETNSREQTPLPADIIRLRDRPALAGGAAYREWLSQSDAVPPGKVSAAQ